MAQETTKKRASWRTPKWKLMQLIYLDLEIDRPEFIEDPTFNVIPNIEDFIDANFDALDKEEADEDEIGVVIFYQETARKWK